VDWGRDGDECWAYLGGVAPAVACGATNMGSQQTVNYQADYIFWKAA
jgi:hypothetical protein